MSRAEVLPVIFRVSCTRAREVTAVFPTLPHDVAGHLITCYARVGQHGGCSWDWYTSRRHEKASPAEYGTLLRELQRIYAPEYELLPVARMTRKHRAAFDAEVSRLASVTLTP